MTQRFYFAHNGINYEVIGNYGDQEKFFVTKCLPGATRMTGAAGTSHGIKVEALVNYVNNEKELRAELNNKFQGLTDFTSH